MIGEVGHRANENDRGLILLGAGGTGGHMFPAQALGEELKRRSYQVLLVTDARGMRYAANFPADHITEIAAANPSARGSIAKMVAGFQMAGGLIRTLQEIRLRKPFFAVGFGGYPSLPAMQGARLSKIPFGLHEQNSLLGRANRFLAPGAEFLAHAFPVLQKVPAKLRNAPVEVGNPIRDRVRAVSATPYSLPDNARPFRLLITGGSQGARLFSEVPVEAILALPDTAKRRLEVIHQVRAEDEERVSKAYREAGIDAKTAPFFEDLPALMSDSHLVIARAGASTITELSVMGRPAILVPLASAMDDHQTANARVLSDMEAAILIGEADFNATSLGKTLAGLIEAPQTLQAMAAQAKDRVKIDAASAIADLIETHGM